MELVPHIKIWLSTTEGENVIGGGRIALLQAIHKLGSLSAAAEELGISYRKAWGDLKRAESSIGLQLIDKNRGGASGGTTVLTAAGEQLLNACLVFDAEMKEHMEASYNKLVKGLVNGPLFSLDAKKGDPS